MQEMDQRDRELLSALQEEIPLVSTPFAVLGQKLDMSEKEVIKRIERLKREGIVRHLAAQFDARALGHHSCLVAARVAAERVDEAAAVIGAHPGVTQNFRRNHEFNLWFTIVMSPLSKLGLDRTVEVLGREAECETIRTLPTLRLFKTTATEGESNHEADSQHEYTPLSTAEIEAVRMLQRELPLQPRPFDVLARVTNIAPEDLLGAARTLHRRGQIRRFAAIVQPRKVGFTSTAMGVWAVPEQGLDEYAAKLSQHRAVSHCYLRPIYEDWPYNLYTTVHGRSVDECESIINDLAIDTGLTQKQALFPTKEYGKSRVSFFSPEVEEWESVRGSEIAAAVG